MENLSAPLIVHSSTPSTTLSRKEPRASSSNNTASWGKVVPDAQPVLANLLSSMLPPVCHTIDLGAYSPADVLAVCLIYSSMMVSSHTITMLMAPTTHRVIHLLGQLAPQDTRIYHCPV